jgi:sugar phosphate isomerase/epimerase
MDVGTAGLCVSTLLPDPMTCHPDDFERALQAAAGAGFTSVSLWEAHVAAYGTEATRLVLDDLGLTARAIETVTGWPRGDGPVGAAVERQLALVPAVGADIVHSAARPPTTDRAGAAAGFAALCLAADRYGLTVALEFVPTRPVADLATAWAIVAGAGAPNGGLALDVMHWHHQPGGPDPALLATIPGDRVVCLQVCDAPPGPLVPATYTVATLTTRPLPGDGVADIGALFETLETIGAAPYVTLEVFNRSMADEGMDRMAGRLRAVAAAMSA